MKCRRGHWIAAGVLAATAAVAIGWVALSPAPLRVEDSKKVRLNFNLAACERQLGQPPTRREWYPRTEGLVPLYLVPLDSEGRPGFSDIPDEMAEWESSRAVIRVYFTRGRVVGVTAEEQIPPLWLRLARRIGP